MDTNTIQKDQREAFRIPTPGQSTEVELFIGGNAIPAQLKNESSGGFGLYTIGKPPVKKDDIVEIHVHNGRYRVRIAYVRPYSNDSRIQVAEQDESGEIRTLVDPDEQQIFCIGVERLEDLSYHQDRSKRRPLEYIMRLPTKLSGRHGNSIALFSLIGAVAFPVILFVGFAIALQFGHFGGFTSNSNEASIPTESKQRVSNTTFSSSASTPTTGGASREKLHSTRSSTITKSTSQISSRSRHRSSPSESLGQLLETLFSDNAPEEASEAGNQTAKRSGRANTTKSDNHFDYNKLTQQQRNTLEQIVAEAQKRLENGATPQQVKEQLKAAIKTTLNGN